MKFFFQTIIVLLFITITLDWIVVTSSYTFSSKSLLLVTCYYYYSFPQQPQQQHQEQQQQPQQQQHHYNPFYSNAFVPFVSTISFQQQQTKFQTNKKNRFVSYTFHNIFQKQQQSQQQQQQSQQLHTLVQKQSNNNNIDDNNNNNDDCNDDDSNFRSENRYEKSFQNSISNRRKFLISFPITTCFVSMIGTTEQVSARGLVQFPCPNGLANSYHLLRVGTTMLENEGILSTNPLFLTNQDDSLTPAGIEQIIEACNKLSMSNRAPTVVKYSLAASCIDTANVVQRQLRLGRDRIIPEFTFMDPRAVGAWDRMSKADVEPAVWALDHDEGAIDGSGGRPPPNEDGTPHETLGDQAIRLRQVFSILETQYSGDTILLIFPDGTGPALLSAMIAGIPYNRAHQLEFAPGEVRFDVTYQSTRALLQEKEKDGSIALYNQKIELGRKALERLNESNPMNGGAGYVNLIDQKLEKERLEVDEAVDAKYQLRRLAEIEAENVRKQRQVQYKQSEKGVSPSPLLLGTSGLLTVAAISLVLSRDETNSNQSQQNDESLASMEPVSIPGSTDPISTTSLYTSTPEAIKVNGARTESSTYIAQRLDPKIAAEMAMQEYLDRDDGGEDWIRALADIIQESDDNDNIENDVQETKTVLLSNETNQQPQQQRNSSMFQ